MGMGAGFPEQLISKLRTNDAALSRKGKSLVMASSHKSLKFDEASANMRRLFGSRGGSGRIDALITGEAVGPLGNDGDLGACLANKKAEEHGVGQKKKDGVPIRGGDKVRGDRADIEWV